MSGKGRLMPPVVVSLADFFGGEISYVRQEDI